MKKFKQIKSNFETIQSKCSRLLPILKNFTKYYHRIQKIKNSFFDFSSKPRIAKPISKTHPNQRFPLLIIKSFIFFFSVFDIPLLFPIIPQNLQNKSDVLHLMNYSKNKNCIMSNLEEKNMYIQVENVQREKKNIEKNSEILKFFEKFLEKKTAEIEKKKKRLKEIEALMNDKNGVMEIRSKYGEESEKKIFTNGKILIYYNEAKQKKIFEEQIKYFNQKHFFEGKKTVNHNEFEGKLPLIKKRPDENFQLNNFQSDLKENMENSKRNMGNLVF